MSKDTHAPWKDESLLREKYCEEGLTIQEIADKWDTTFDTVRYYKDKYEIEGRPNGVSPSVNKLTKDRLQKLYHEEGKSLTDIGDEFDVSETTVLDRMREFGIDRRVADHKREGAWQDEDTLYQLYHKENLSLEEIGDKLGCSASAVSTWMEKFDIERDPIPEEMPPNYRTKHGGYEEVRTKINQKQYTVLIHRLVAVSDGLLSGEELINGDKHIHHKNGIEWDNRPDNLEVLSKSEHHSLHFKEREIGEDGKLL